MSSFRCRKGGTSIDLLSQRDVFLPCSLLLLFAIVDVGPSRIPADDLAMFVPQRVVLD